MEVVDMPRTFSLLAVRTKAGFRLLVRRLCDSQGKLPAVLAAVLSFACVDVQSVKTRKDLDDAVTEVSTAVSAKQAQNQQVIEIINVLVAKPQTLVVGNVTAYSGDTVELPIIFKAGILGIASLQFDLHFSPAIGLDSTQAGPASTAASKSVQTQLDNGRLRVIIFGLNQNTVSSGIVAIVKLTMPARIGFKEEPVTIDNIVASSGIGDPVPVTGKAGLIVERL